MSTSRLGVRDTTRCRCDPYTAWVRPDSPVVQQRKPVMAVSNLNAEKGEAWDLETLILSKQFGPEAVETTRRHAELLRNLVTDTRAGDLVC